MAKLVDAHIRGVKFSPCLKHSSMDVDVQCRFKSYSLHKDFPVGGRHKNYIKLSDGGVTCVLRWVRIPAPPTYITIRYKIERSYR